MLKEGGGGAMGLHLQSLVRNSFSEHSARSTALGLMGVGDLDSTVSEESWATSVACRSNLRWTTR